MDASEQTEQRVLSWRIKGLPTRIGQTCLVGLLCWFANGQMLVVPWIAASVVSGWIDARLARVLMERPGDRRLAAINAVSRVVSATMFALVMFVLVLGPQRGTIACAILVGCATILNNAIMTRGSRPYAATLVGPSAFVLVATPFVAHLVHQSVSANIAILLAVGVISYVAFIARLAETLYKEDRALRDALEAAQTANRVKSDFLATVSHEIRTPLNGVLGMAQALRYGGLNPSQLRHLDVITESGESLLAILNDILDLSKIEAGKLLLEDSDFDIEDMAGDARAAFAPEAHRKGLSFELIVEEAASGVYHGDSKRVRQILYTLLSNAIKFTEAGEAGGVISRTDSGLRLIVTDTGVGIAPERIDHLFDKFVQADSSRTRQFGGVGVGLTICKALCSSMGGKISVISALGAGSQFTVDLPLVRAEPLTSRDPAAKAGDHEAAAFQDHDVRLAQPVLISPEAT